MKIKLSDLPADVVEKLKPLSHGDFKMLATDAYNLRDKDTMAALPGDPTEAAQKANACLIRNETLIDVDDAEGFVESVLELAMVALGNPDFDSMDAVHLHRVIRAGRSAFHEYVKNTTEAHKHLRAAFYK